MINLFKKKKAYILNICIIFFIFLFSLAPRVFMISSNRNLTTGDETEIIYLAESIANGKGYNFFNGTTPYLPLYPIFIALFNLLTGINIKLSAEIIASLSISLSSIVLYFITLRLFKNKFVGFTASLLYAFSPINFIATTKPFTEGLFMFFSLMSIFYFIISNSRKNIIIGSAIALLACLTRYEGLLMLIIGILGFYVINYKKNYTKRYLLVSFLFISVITTFVFVRIFINSKVTPINQISNEAYKEIIEYGSFSKRKAFLDEITPEQYQVFFQNLQHKIPQNFKNTNIFLKEIEKSLTSTIFFLTVIGIFFILKHKEFKSLIFLSFWFFLFAVFRISIQGNISGRYFIEILPIFTILASYALISIFNLAKKSIKKFSYRCILGFLILSSLLIPILKEYVIIITEEEKIFKINDFKKPITNAAFWFKNNLKENEKILVQLTDIGSLWYYSQISNERILIAVDSYIYWGAKSSYVKSAGVILENLNDLSKLIEKENIRYIYVDNLYPHHSKVISAARNLSSVLQEIWTFTTEKSGLQSKIYKINREVLKKVANKTGKIYYIEPSIYPNCSQSSGSYSINYFFTDRIINTSEWIKCIYNLPIGEYLGITRLPQGVGSIQVFLDNNLIQNRYSLDVNPFNLEFKFDQPFEKDIEIKIIANPIKDYPYSLKLDFLIFAQMLK